MLGRRVGWEPLLPDYQPLHRAVVRTHSLLPSCGSAPMPRLPLTKEALVANSPPNSCPIQTWNSTLPAVPFWASVSHRHARFLVVSVRESLVLTEAWLRLNR